MPLETGSYFGNSSPGGIGANGTGPGFFGSGPSIGGVSAGGGGIRLPGIGGGSGPVIGGSGGGGGNPFMPPQINTRYQGQRSPVMNEILGMFREQMNRGRELYEKAPDFSGQRANINKMQSISRNEAIQQAGARGGLGLTPAQMQNMQRGEQQAMTGAARDWGNEALRHQENILGQLTGMAQAMSGSELGQLGNVNDQIRLQQAANAQGFNAWLEQAKLPIALMQAQNSGTAAILSSLFPYVNMANQNNNRLV